MIFIANADGSIKAVLPSTVNQGSNVASRIILIGPFLTSNRVKCAFRLPNGMVSGYEEANPIEMTQLDLSNTELGSNYTAWYYDLQDFVTAIKGTVSVQFTIYNGTQKITTTAQDFQVLRGVENLEPNITQTEYGQIEGALSDINANIETINRAIDELKTKTSILKTDGSGNEFLAADGNYKPINIPTVDSELSLTSTNAVENKVVTENLNKKLEPKDIATINGQTITAGGNITIESGETVTVDSALSLDSENPVQNKVVTEALNDKVNKSNVTYKAVYARYASEDTTIPVANATEDATMNLNGCIPFYINDINGNHLRVNTPNKDVDAANKKYVDDNKGTKLYRHTITIPYSEDSEMPTYENNIIVVFKSYNSENTISNQISRPDVNELQIDDFDTDYIISPPLVGTHTLNNGDKATQMNVEYVDAGNSKGFWYHLLWSELGLNIKSIDTANIVEVIEDL